MTIRYHEQRKLFNVDAPQSDRLNRFRHWDASNDPDSMYAEHGWTVELVEAEPTYDGSLLIGTKVRVYNGDGNTYSWQVDGKPWTEAVDAVANAKKRCRSALDAATSGSQQATIDYVIPTGGTLDGEDAAGQTVQLWMIHPEVETYWVDFKSMFDARGAFAREEFDCTTGRVQIDGSDMAAVFALVATHGSQRRTAWRRLERAIAKATTVEEYDAIRAMIEV